MLMMIIDAFDDDEHYANDDNDDVYQRQKDAGNKTELVSGGQTIM